MLSIIIDICKSNKKNTKTKIKAPNSIIYFCTLQESIIISIVYR